VVVPFISIIYRRRRLPAPFLLHRAPGWRAAGIHRHKPPCKAGGALLRVIHLEARPVAPSCVDRPLQVHFGSARARRHETPYELNMACRLYIDSHLSSAAGGTPLHRQPPQLGCRRSGAAPLIIDGHIGSAAGEAASSTSTFSSSMAPSWLALHIQHRLDDDAAAKTPGPQATARW